MQVTRSRGVAEWDFSLTEAQGHRGLFYFSLCPLWLYGYKPLLRTEVAGGLGDYLVEDGDYFVDLAGGHA